MNQNSPVPVGLAEQQGFEPLAPVAPAYEISSFYGFTVVEENLVEDARRSRKIKTTLLTMKRKPNSKKIQSGCTDLNPFPKDLKTARWKDF